MAYSTSKTKIYLIDANKDGLIDIVKETDDGEYAVYFNHLENGNPTFETSSKKTENVLVTGEMNISEIPDTPEDIGDEYEPLQNLAQIPNYDVVRVWVAPEDGVINRISDNMVFTGENNDFVYYSIETYDLGTIDADTIGNFIHFPMSRPYRLFFRKFDSNHMSELITIHTTRTYTGFPLGDTLGNQAHTSYTKGKWISFVFIPIKEGSIKCPKNPRLFYTLIRVQARGIRVMRTFIYFYILLGAYFTGLWKFKPIWVWE